MVEEVMANVGALFESDLRAIDDMIDTRLQEVAPDVEEGCRLSHDNDVSGALRDHLGDYMYDTMLGSDREGSTTWALMSYNERQLRIRKVVDRYYPEAS